MMSYTGLRLLLLIGGSLLCSNLLVADILEIAGSTSGSFSQDVAPDLMFTGRSFSGTVDEPVVLGTLNLQRPGTNSPDHYNGRTFLLELIFTAPGTLDLTHVGALSGNITHNGNGNKLSVDFPDIPTQLVGLCIAGQDCGSLYLTVSDLSGLIPGDFGDPESYNVIGTFTRETVVVATPEPASVILLITAGALCFGVRRKFVS